MKGRTKRQIVTAGATFAAALGIGFVMQYGDAVAGRGGIDAPVAGPNSRITDTNVAIPVAATMAVPVTLGTPDIRVPTTLTQRDASSTPVALDDVDVPTMFSPVVLDDAAPALDADTPQELPEDHSAAPDAAVNAPKIVIGAPAATSGSPAELPTVASCETVMTVAESDLAMVKLDLSNPCRANAVVAIHHQGMMFHELTDADGNLVIDVPVVAEEAFFIAAYDDGEGAVAMTGVPSLAMYDRAVLQWQGESRVQLHALEFGAAYGEPGHVWNGEPSDPMRTIAGLGGHLQVLGNPEVPNALMAEIYTFPTGMSLQDGNVELSVEAEITDLNCGRPVEAESLQVVQGQEPLVLDLAVTLPNCDGVGEYLVLKNMFEDLTLAAR